VLRLITLGGLALYRDGRALSGSATQRLRLALLARIGSAGPRGVRRDALIALLWPDSGPERGRHSLEQALHGMFTGTAVVGFNTDVVTADVADFDAAIARGDADRAVSLYAGAFLEGFHLPNAPEFDQWAGGERTRCARQYASALETLARAAADAKDRASAVHWWRRLAIAEPLSARVAVSLVEALVAIGDRSGALQHAIVHASLVRSELDSPPDPEIAAWTGRLRSGAVPTGPRAAAPSVATPPHPVAQPDADERMRCRLVDSIGERYALASRADASKTVITFAAVDRHTSAPVYVHVVRPWVSANVDVERAARILRSVASVDHPSVVPVLDAGTADDLVYYIGPPRNDPSLRDRLARAQLLPVPDAMRVAVDLCSALACAEEHDVRHGDLRPRHVLLGGPRAAVRGFGLVDALRWTHDSSPGTTAVTRGAPAYVSPDILAGQSEPDARSDVYAVGCILFEMLAGAPPFAGGGAQALVARKLSGAAPHVRDVRPSVPDALDRLIATCLAPFAADRFQTASALCAAIEGV
jgi:DNA-binding SARP family transcriptional activator